MKDPKSLWPVRQTGGLGGIQTGGLGARFQIHEYSGVGGIGRINTSDVVR